MELTEQQLNLLRQIILDEIAKIKEGLAHSKETSKPVSLDDPIGRLSRMDAIQQQNMAKETHRRALLRLTQLEAALKRWSEDLYGYCVSCDEPIHFGRLKIKPESTLCLRCQNMQKES